ncbi:hypothetical protein HMPREF1624_01575 [Sporothrix schenckii ATCC 58251]|uniref:RING-type domain-containing protein n=1 Tax=Sporothrix schenckii (strain ATCC 58251 / de Perez 2211183) TaxID=1391915 RepID=U7Q5U7_SPOS1|nr:hypothetical protein HMPREF1624_01575 [Sporothrix schenckii ATCC 58251]
MDSTSPKEAVGIEQRQDRWQSNSRAGRRSSTKRHTSWVSHKSHNKRKSKSKNKKAKKGKAKSSTRSLTRSQAIWAARAPKRIVPKTRRPSQQVFWSMVQTETGEQVIVTELTDASTATSTDISTDSRPCPCPDETDLQSVPVNNPLDVASPVLFPGALDGVLPRTDLAGAHNCGGHLHILDIDYWHSSLCRDCNKYNIPVGELHILPCGHYLCLRCLNKKAASVAQSIYDADVWEKVQQALHDTAFAESFYNYDDDYDGRPMYGRQQGPGPNSRQYDPPWAALQAVGMLCCGMDARLDHFLGCLDPAVSTAYWIAYAAVRVQQPEDLRSRCGWPDCRRQLVPANHFVRHDQLQYAFCLSCGGTSLIKDREGSTIPARAWQEDEEST